MALPVNSRLPEAVADLARRLGADAALAHRQVRLTQTGTMRSGPGRRSMRFAARQSIDLARPQFEWRASTGPLSAVTVIDKLAKDETCSEVRICGLLRFASSARNDPAVIKSQIMRYLAELPWAPDAILLNRMLKWTADNQTVVVSADSRAGPCSVNFSLDPQGRIASISAADRPRIEEGRFVERPWRGMFADYRRHCGRWLPFKAEVGWILGGTFVTVWHGNVKTWQIL